MTVSDLDGCTATTNVNVIISETYTPAYASVAIAADNNNVCTGTTTNFIASATNGGTPTYQWEVNNNDVGNNSSTYSYIPVNNDIVSCIMTSSYGCDYSNPATSNTIVMTVFDVSVGGTATGTASTVCSGSNTNINLTGYTGAIQWQQSADGSTGWQNVTGGSGGTTATYTTPTLTSTTYYRAEVTNGVCSSGLFINSFSKYKCCFS